MAKRIISALFHFSLLIFTFSLPAAIPVRWTVDTFRVKPLVYDCYHGETLDLAAAMTAYGEPLDLHGKTAKLYWQTNGMDSAYWSTNATIKADKSTVHLSPTPTHTNILSATFSGSFDPGAPTVSGFIGVEGENYRAAFQLNFRASPGFTPAHIAPPVRVLDFATTTVANPEASPFMVKGGSGGVTAQQATNIASAVVAPIASTQSVHSAAISSHSSQLSQLSQSVAIRTTTNDVNAIIASSNLCPKANAEVEGKLEIKAQDGNSGCLKLYFDDEIACSLSVSPDGLEGTFSELYIPFNSLKNSTSGKDLEQYLMDLDFIGENNTLDTFRIKNAYTKTQIDGNAVTNGGAKAYADATFLKKTGGYMSENASINFLDENGIDCTTINRHGISYTQELSPQEVFGTCIFDIKFESGQYSKEVCVNFRGRVNTYSELWTESKLTPDGSCVLTQLKGDNRYLRYYTETDPTATAKAQAAIASTLSGRTYDFHNGDNFTKNLYIALTNVIQTLGGTVANPPAFN